MRQYGLYCAIKDIINDKDSDYKITFNDMLDDAENYIGVYIRGGLNATYRRLSDGSYVNKRDRVQLVMQSGRSKASVIKLNRLGNYIIDRFPTLNNYNILLDTGKCGYNSQHEFILASEDEEIVNAAELVILRTDPQSGLIMAGKNEQGLSKYSINFVVEYYIQEVSENGN